METRAKSGPRMRRVGAVVALLLAAVVFAAWQLRPATESGHDVAPAASAGVTSGPASNPAEAVAKLQDQEDGQREWRVQRSVVIFADSRLIDLRVQAVTPDDDCRWFAVSGEVEDGQLAWRAGHVPTDVGTCGS